MIKLDKYRVLQHILFWVILISYDVGVVGYGLRDFKQPLYSALFSVPVDMLAVYFTLYVLTPKFLYKKKYLSFVAGLLVSALVVTTLERYLYRFHVIPIISPQSKEALNPTLDLFSASFFLLMRNIYYIVFLALGLKLLKNWYLQEQQKKELERQSLHSELAMLRQQLSPHFLFNTLNNIDTLIYKNQPMASESIMKLSDIMRYMLYETGSDHVPLHVEIKYIQSYIDLFRLTIKDPEFIRFSLEGAHFSRLVAPMLFIPFIENAFKHGSKKTETSPGIDIRLSVEDSELYFYVSNVRKEEAGSRDHTSGIGLKNVRRRLDLLYGDQYELRISESADRYEVSLEIQFMEEE